jgi:eukaryotic-like serine/threonine-protein kinase
MSDDRLIANRYRLNTRLGSGGMGVVWRAYDERLHRTVAVKQLLMPPELTGPQAEAAKRRVVREGRIAARLQHPNSITVFDVVEDGGQPYLVMEYLPATSLSALLANRGTLPPAEVADIGAQAAAALAAAHAAGVVHRDVKPGNVLLGDDGTVKITDFGIARAVEDAATATTGVFGTPAYLSPEVVKGERATAASDVFSLGSTMYTSVEGAPPFGSSDNAMAVLYRIGSGQLAPPTQAGPLTGVLERMLSIDPHRRPTMAEVRDTLAEVAARPTTSGIIPATASPDDSIPPGGTPAGDNRRPAMVAAAVVVLLALAGTLLVLALNQDVAGGGHAAQPATSSSAGPTTGQPAPTTGQPSQPPANPPPGTTVGVPAATAPPQAPPPDIEATPPAAVVTDYYALMPGNLDEGWTRLTPKYQQYPAGGFSGYQSFWSRIRSVRVSDVTATGDNTVEATVEYHMEDGRVIREQHRYTLIMQDGRWKIDESAVLRSVTL